MLAALQISQIIKIIIKKKNTLKNKGVKNNNCFLYALCDNLKIPLVWLLQNRFVAFEVLLLLVVYTHISSE